MLSPRESGHGRRETRDLRKPFPYLRTKLNHCRHLHADGPRESRSKDEPRRGRRVDTRVDTSINDPAVLLECVIRTQSIA